jgi:UDP-N-acetylglucosamine 2-epimerase
MIILYCANRAEKSILDPIKQELDHRNIKNEYVDLSKVVGEIENDANLSRIYDFVFKQLDTTKDIKCGIVIGDRREIMFASLALFIKEVPVIQLASGDLSDQISLVDDYFRHLITVMSKKQICFTAKSQENCDKILNALNLDSQSVFYPNPTLSDLDLNKKVFNQGHDLILVHPQSLSQLGTQKDRDQVKSLFDKEKRTIIIRGNKDKNYEVLYDLWEDLSVHKNVTIYNNLDKDLFIDVLSSCDRFITNSSCSFYEAPIFLNPDQIVHIGDRNRGREVANYSMAELKSSLKIVDFIVE